jgi:tRNA A-37 threonylcarbamoyl transferase component Bud32/tetratricopeptide (TPR) repeat protein
MSDDTLERLRAALHAQYAVDRQIGQGGMATVFLAEDLKHHRRVAIKVLRPELTASLGTDRFLREIELAANLQHPHIVPVYDSGAADGFLYYVMPFVEGESLRDLLQREGRVPIERAAEIVRDAASGLAYAHNHGVVHRDIKPENIMLSGGHAVVADFGIARAIDASRSATAGLTGTGVAIGTPAYMSPEQATADAVDARSDQYALACVFYEMVSGAQAFTAPTMQALLTKVLTGARPKLATVVATTPPGLDSTVQRALAQDPADRFPDIMAFANAVTQESSGAAAATRESRRWKRVALIVPFIAVAAVLAVVFAMRPHRVVVSGAETIAVVPFSAAGTGVENLGEGMVDLIGGNLDGVGGIHTIESRQVIRAWQRRATNGIATLDDAIAVARSVKAASVLTGSLLATGQRTRVTAELYDLNGKQLAREFVEGPTDSVLSLADALALKLLHSIWRSKEPLPSAKSSAITSTSMEAIRAYLDGEKWYRRGEWDSAQVAFEHAVHADSTFALAWYKLASTLGWEGQVGTAASSIAGKNAVRYSMGLPARIRTTFVAYELFQRGRPEAVDSMRSYTALHPEDADGWYLLGEAQYHTRDYHPLPPAELDAPFDRVLALDSTLTAAAIHPMELSIEERDTSLSKRYLRVFELANAQEEVDGAKSALAVLRGADTAIGGLMTVTTGGMRMAALTALARAPGTTGDRLEAALHRFVARMPPDGAMQSELVLGAVTGALGRQIAARHLGDTVAAMPGAAAINAREYVTMMPILGGFADSAMLARFGNSIDSLAAKSPPAAAPAVAFFRALIALDQNQVAKAGAILQPVLAQLNPKLPDFLRGGLIGLDGLRLAMSGDAARGIARADSGMRIVGGFGNPVYSSAISLRLAQYLVSQPGSRAAGIARLRYGFQDRFEYGPIVQYDLGKAYEAAGDRSNAAAAYGQFLRLWDHADSNFQPRITDARAALQRLSGEGAKR